MMKTRRNIPMLKKLTACLTAGMMLNILSCIPAAGVQFRAAATAPVKAGITQIVNGVLEGLFAVVELENDAGSGDTSSQ